MQPSTSIINSNKEALIHLKNALSLCPTEHYFHCDLLPMQGIGPHVRHIVEHYQQFLQYTTNTINYDLRKRAIQLEKDKYTAQKAIDAILVELSENTDTATHQTVYLETTLLVASNFITVKVPTTVERELIFLLQHTVHHCAQIAIILRCLGIETDDKLECSPATLTYQQNKVIQEKQLVNN